jgi:hypothetical protein
MSSNIGLKTIMIKNFRGIFHALLSILNAECSFCINLFLIYQGTFEISGIFTPAV